MPGQHQCHISAKSVPNQCAQTEIVLISCSAELRLRVEVFSGTIVNMASDTSPSHAKQTKHQIAHNQVGSWAAAVVIFFLGYATSNARADLLTEIVKCHATHLGAAREGSQDGPDEFYIQIPGGNSNSVKIPTSIQCPVPPYVVTYFLPRDDGQFDYWVLWTAEDKTVAKSYILPARSLNSSVDIQFPDLQLPCSGRLRGIDGQPVFKQLLSPRFQVDCLGTVANAPCAKENLLRWVTVNGTYQDVPGKATPTLQATERPSDAAIEEKLLLSLAKHFDKITDRLGAQTADQLKDAIKDCKTVTAAAVDLAQPSSSLVAAIEQFKKSLRFAEDSLFHPSRLQTAPKSEPSSIQR